MPRARTQARAYKKCGWCTVSIERTKCEINRKAMHQCEKKLVTRTHKYRKNDWRFFFFFFMRNNEKDRKLELYTLRHFHNGKQYFRIHCTCSPPTKTNICLMRIKSVDPIVVMIVVNIRSCACLIRQMLSHSLRRLSYTWLIFSCCQQCSAPNSHVFFASV